MHEGMLREHYLDRGFGEDAAERAVCAVRSFVEDCAGRVPKGDEWKVFTVRAYLDRQVASGASRSEDVLALARYAYLTGHRDAYVYFTSIVGIDDIVRNLSERVRSIAGDERRARIFDDLAVPPAGSPPEAFPPMTAKMVSRMQTELSPAECRTALTGNMHGISAELFADERGRFLAASSLDEHLADSHRRSVATLQRHCDENKVWFEQVITQEVVDFVSAEPEILGGVRHGNRIFTTKIPYKPDEWLAETDPARRRYLACHCPLAREALGPSAGSRSQVPPVWCRCSAGYHKVRFDVVFDREVEIEVLENVLEGGDRCRFAVTIPDSILGDVRP